jgi:Tfp pilus assembly PilM family ATPase
MTQLLAIEWDSREARLAVATAGRGSLRIDELFTVGLVAADGETELPDAEVAERIAAAVRQRKLAKAETLVAVARASIELKPLSLPPAPVDELPDLTRFQALRDFNALGDDWPLDFIPLSGSDTEPRTVLAAAIAPQAIKEILAICAPAELDVKHIVLRPCAAASLLRRRPADARIRLLLDVFNDEADLTVLVEDTVVFMRTARLSHGLTSTERAQNLVAETRRTMVAVANQLSGQRVEKICVCGDGPEFKALAIAIEEQIKLPTIVFDPLDSVDLSNELRRAPPVDVGRWAPLLGMLLDEAQGQRHAIDFLDPKKRPVPPSHKQRNSLIAASVAAAVLLLAGWIWIDLGNRDEANAALQSRINANLVKDPADKKTPLDRTKDTQAAWEEVEKWFDGDAVWLDELAFASERVPDSSKMMVTQLLIASDGRGPAMTVTGLAKDVATIDAAESSLRDKLHRVESRGTSEDNSRPGYTHKFSFVLRPYATEEAATAASATQNAGAQGRSRFPANRNSR